MYKRILTNPLIQRIIHNSGYLLSATGISAGISMIQGILTARLLGVAGFGILGAITMFTSVINKFASFRMSELVVKYVGQFSEQKDTQRASAVFKSAAILEILASFIAFGLLFTMAPLGARYLAKDITTQPLFLLYGFILLANLISESSTGILQIFDRFRYIAYTNIIQSILTLIIITGIYLSKGGLQEIIIAYLIGKVVGAMAVSLTALWETTRQWGWGWWKVSLTILHSQAKELIRFAISTNISGSLSIINKDSELLWISFFRNPIETGYYKLALALANMVQLPISPLPQVTYPELSREIARRNWKNVRYILRQGALIAGIYTVGASLFLLLFGQLVIRFLYTSDYLPAYPALLILLVGFLIANTFYWNRTALLAIGKPDLPVKINLVLAIIKVSCIIIFVPLYGYLINAGLMSASYLIGVSISVILFYRVLAVNETADQKKKESQ